jgi:hypothetical protein
MTIFSNSRRADSLCAVGKTEESEAERTVRRLRRSRVSSSSGIKGSGRTAGRYASAARAFISPTAFEQARGEAL